MHSISKEREDIGGCHCGNITLKIKFSSELNLYTPRTCDCDFCLKHGASYISDKNGKLMMSVKQESELSRYRHGNKIADFLICKICGVLIAACYQDRDCLYATVNSRILSKNALFKEDTVVSPKKLDGIEKIARWKNVWFSDVVLSDSKSDS